MLKIVEVGPRDGMQNETAAIATDAKIKFINASIKSSIQRFRPVVTRAAGAGLPVRGYISTAFWCAFEGR